MVSEAQKQARRLDTDTTHECERCGEEFESWMAFIKDNFVDIVNWTKRKEEYEHLCQDCNEEYFEGTPGFDDE